MRIASLILVASALGLGACGADSRKAATPAPQTDAPAALEFYDRAVTGLSYSAAPANPRARLFLVSGSMRGANFAQDMLNQRQHWLAQGFKAEDISCFYVMPDRVHFDRAKTAYQAMAAELSQCHAASAHNLRAHLAAADKSGEFVYLYVSSNGSAPIQQWIDTETDPAHKTKLQRAKDDFPFLDQYSLALDATAQGAATFGFMLRAHLAGAAAEDLFLTPRYLRASLAAWPVSARKIAVLQGCHSGGFIEESNAAYLQDTLTSLSKVSVLTSTRHDRSSFGCSLAPTATYYGSALQTTLQESPGRPDQIDWAAVQAKVKTRIETMEQKKQVEHPSLPQFYSNL